MNRRLHLIGTMAFLLALTGQSPAQPCLPQWSIEINPGVSGEVNRFFSFDDGAGPALYVGGDFQSVNGTPVANIARYRNGQWSAVGNGLGNVCNAFAAFDFGSGSHLVAAGFYGLVGQEQIGEWNGSQWLNAPESGPHAWLSALRVFQGELYASGAFFFQGSSYFVRWSGGHWSGVGGGLASVVWDMQEFDDGNGLALAVAGIPFPQGVPNTIGIAKWNGTQWQAYGLGINAEGRALEVFNDGGGNALYVGGNFTAAGGAPAARIARWRNGQWSALGAGFNSMVRALAVFDDGTGPALYAGGDFTLSGQTPINHVAKWNGTSWQAVGGGVIGIGSGDSVHDLIVNDDDGPGPIPPALYVGGKFTTAGLVPSSGIARWGRCAQTCAGDVTLNGAVNVDDLLAVINQWGPCPPAPAACSGDISPRNGNGDVNVDDLLKVINSWGMCP